METHWSCWQTKGQCKEQTVRTKLWEKIHTLILNFQAAEVRMLAEHFTVSYIV